MGAGIDELMLQVAREGLLLVLLCSAPPVLAALAVGLLMGVLQAATQVQEQTLSQVPKIVAVAAALLVAGPWMGGQLLRFTDALFAAIAVIGRGGS
ncbi:MAG: type III secretion system export apparatus subunit SctS [bacterium]